MKALTICQPYAHLFLLDQSHPHHKRVENRTWRTPYRGGLYLHAGKNRDWLNLDRAGIVDILYDIPVSRMAFGAVVAVAELIDCVHIDYVGSTNVVAKYPWLMTHKHTSGPWCWIIDKVVPIGPWPWKGAQGLFDIEDGALNHVANQQLGIAEP